MRVALSSHSGIISETPQDRSLSNAVPFRVWAPSPLNAEALPIAALLTACLRRSVFRIRTALRSPEHPAGKLTPFVLGFHFTN